MGLDVSHGCWSGAYSAFMRWRYTLAEVAGLPPLDLMEGFYEYGSVYDPIHVAEHSISVCGAFDRIKENLPIKWDCLKPDPYLYALLYHSDCDGEIAWQDCDSLADRLEKLLPQLEQKGNEGEGHIGSYAKKTKQFIEGLRLAASRKENVEFE